MIDILEIFKNLVPSFTDYSWDKIVRYQGPKSRALEYPYLRVNSSKIVSFLIFDIDKKFVDFGITPTYLVVTPETERCHAVFILRYPVDTSNLRVWDFTKKTCAMLKSLLDADRVITNQRLMTKNPLHDMWEYVPLSEELYTISDLYKQAKGYIDVFGLDVKTFQISFSENSRNCAVFDRLRRENFESFDQYLDLAMKVNPIISQMLNKPPLPRTELVSIARSVFNFKQKEKNKKK